MANSAGLRHYLLGYLLTMVLLSLLMVGVLRPRMEDTAWAATCAGLLAAVSLLFVALFVRRERRWLSSFSEAAGRIASGQFTRSRLLAPRGDPWEPLAQAFRRMSSELQRRERRMSENNRRLEAVLSSMIEGVLAVDEELCVVLANEAASHMLDKTQAQLIGQKLFEVVRVPSFTQAIERVMHGAGSAEAEFETLGAPRRTLRMRVTPLSDQPRPGVAAVLHDVSELRRLETMRQDFVTNVSHELKTPLSSIKAYAETLRLGAIDDSHNNTRFVEQIEAQADLLNRQIGDLLQLSRVESGRAVFELSEIGLQGVFEDCVEQFAAEARQRQVELCVDRAPAELVVYADREAMRTIIDNLVSNGIRYARPGGRVRLSATDEAGDVVIRVADDGIGIAPAEQARVFERFYRVDKARSREVGGTGLGLAIVKHTTQALGGTVGMESRIGRGSTFTIRLPQGRPAG